MADIIALVVGLALMLANADRGELSVAVRAAAEDVVGEALSALVVNKMRGVLDICAMKAPGFGCAK